MTKAKYDLAKKITGETGEPNMRLVLSLLDGGMPEREIRERIAEAQAMDLTLADTTGATSRDRSKSFRWNF